MDVNRLRADVSELEDHYPVKWSLEKNYVMITKFGYPRGWKPRTAPLFFSIPDSYSRRPPEVYLPPDMRYKGSRVEHQLRPNEDGWMRWCIKELEWDPHHHRLLTMMNIMESSLQKPYKDVLIK